MSEPQIIYVCVGNGRPIKTEFEAGRTFNEGDRFEFLGRVVEIIDIYYHPKGTQFQVRNV